MVDVVSTIKFAEAEVIQEDDIVYINVPTYNAMYKDSIRKLRDDIKKHYGVRKVRVDDLKKVKPKVDYRHIDVTITNEITDEIMKLVESNKAMAIDFETDSVNALECNIISCGISFIDNEETFYIPVAHENTDNLRLEVLIEFLKYAQDKCIFVVHNLSFEKKILDRHGVTPEYADTMILTYLKGGLTSQKLKEVAKARLNANMMTYEEVAGKGSKQIAFAQVDPKVAAQYCGSDALYTAQLYKLLLKDLCGDLVSLDHRAALVCSNMEVRGVLIDEPYLRDLQIFYQRRIDRIVKLIYAEAGGEFNINSPLQLQKILFEKKGVVPLSGKKYRTKSDGYKTDKGSINLLLEENPDSRILKYLCEYRSFDKYISTYIKPMLELRDKDGYLHSSFIYVGTETGRLSSRKPNVQNLPKRGAGYRLRGAIIAPAGYTIVAADYSQIEYRFLAHMMQDERFIEKIRQGIDIHTATASLMFGIEPEDVTDAQRDAGKTLNFSVVYGKGVKGMALQLNVSTEQAKSFKTAYFEGLPNFEATREKIWQGTRDTNFSKTLFGRGRYLPNINSPNSNLRAEAERQAFNASIQGTAADLVREAMWRSEQMCKCYDARLVLQVHDELVFYVRDEEVDQFIAELKPTLEIQEFNSVKINVPIQVDIGKGKRYSEAK
jgi:DNA polymerase-1